MKKTLHILYKAPREGSREVHVLTMEIRQYVEVASSNHVLSRRKENLESALSGGGLRENL
jgi:hypothetical protein